MIDIEFIHSPEPPTEEGYYWVKYPWGSENIFAMRVYNYNRKLNEPKDLRYYIFFRGPFTDESLEQFKQKHDYKKFSYSKPMRFIYEKEIQIPS